MALAVRGRLAWDGESDGDSDLRFSRGSPWLLRMNRYYSACKNCRWRRVTWEGEWYILDDASGWWELAVLHKDYMSTTLCGCRFYDDLGTELHERTPILVRYTADRGRKFAKRSLVIDYVVQTLHVKYFDRDDADFSDDRGPRLGVSDVLAISSVKVLLKTVQLMRLQKTRWRSASALCGATTLRSILRLRLCSSELRRVVRAGVTDKALVQAFLESKKLRLNIGAIVKKILGAHAAVEAGEGEDGAQATEKPGPEAKAVKKKNKSKKGMP